ncbi:MAG: hypothetical protein RLZZ271_818 [Pseudomonadota bacterium]|jgi:uncharacterized protein
MKWLLLAVVLLVACLVWKRAQVGQRPSTKRQSPQPDSPVQMRACLQCGVHAPEADVVWGHRGAYCSHAHCQRAGDQPRP